MKLFRFYKSNDKCLYHGVQLFEKHGRALFGMHIRSSVKPKQFQPLIWKYAMVLDLFYNFYQFEFGLWGKSGLHFRNIHWELWRNNRRFKKMNII